MTAIAAFNCVDGVVLAADTEETYQQDNKAYSHKLFPVERPHWNLCLAGSGSAYLIDYAKDKIVSAVESGIKNNVDFEIRLTDLVNTFYREEFSRYPVDSKSQLEIQLLIAVHFVQESDPSKWARPALFECQSNLVTRVPLGRSRILGVGELLTELATQFAGWHLTANLAEWASLYIIHEAKRRFGGVGGKTHTCIMWADGKKMKYQLGRYVREKEAILEAFARISQLLVLSLEPSVTESKSKDFIDAAKAWLANARREMRNIEREYEKRKTTSVVIHDREIRKMIRRLKSTPAKSEEQ
jgi:hypothetical protein